MKVSANGSADGDHLGFEGYRCNSQSVRTMMRNGPGSATSSCRERLKLYGIAKIGQGFD
jgi:hypothetical protein